MSLQPNSRPVHVFQAQGCRWPLWSNDAGLEEKSVCGAACQEGHSFCEAHALITNRLNGFTDAQEAALVTGLLLLVETLEGDPLNDDEMDNCLSSYGLIRPLDAVGFRALFDSLMQPAAAEMSPSIGFLADFADGRS